MSEFHINVVEIGTIEKHPNADTLSITSVDGYPCIIRTGEFTEGDRAVYIPVDSILPKDEPRWEFLAGHLRVKAKKLRGIFTRSARSQRARRRCRVPTTCARASL